MITSLIQTELESLGLTVVGTAGDGRDAVAMTTALKPDVVLMDISMPYLNGIDAAAAIQVGCPTPVVILAAHDETELLVKATAAGVGAFVLKPPQALELARAITIAVARHADLMELRRVNDHLQQTLAEVKTLKGLLPICASCKKIRDEKDYWSEVEVYVMKHTDAEFTHSLCPTCVEKYFPGMDLGGAKG